MPAKITIKLTALFTFIFMSFSAFSVEKNDQQAIPVQCQQLFKETDKLLVEAQRQPGTHTQLSKIQNKLNQSKKQILQMEVATQIKSCDQGLAKLSHLDKNKD
ncbi:DUF5339 domain-containing protein [Pasteurellaceae bacterium 22721_9_1]